LGHVRIGSTRTLAKTQGENGLEKEGPHPDKSAYRHVGNAVAPCSWTPEESQVKSYEHQDNANIHRQPFPESVSEEREIYTDYDGCHCHPVKNDSYLSAHFRLYSMGYLEFPAMRVYGIMSREHCLCLIKSW
jgi:hypothetical protein